jgi:isopentenyl diphosphate isomerase/L-lactate dehydrogenase-like FMN-dependent dehydrogenase
MKADIDVALALTGCASVGALDRSALYRGGASLERGEVP